MYQCNWCFNVVSPRDKEKHLESCGMPKDFVNNEQWRAKAEQEQAQEQEKGVE